MKIIQKKLTETEYKQAADFKVMTKKQLRQYIGGLKNNISVGFDEKENQEILDDVLSKLEKGIELSNGTVFSEEELKDSYAPYSDSDSSTQYVFNKITENKPIKITKEKLENIINEEINNILKEQKAPAQLNRQLVNQAISKQEELVKTIVKGLVPLVQWDNMKPSEIQAYWRQTPHPVKGQWKAYVQKNNTKTGDGGLRNTNPDAYLKGIIAITNQALKNASNWLSSQKKKTNTKPGMSAKTQKPARQQSDSKRKKTIALQTMLVKTGAAPRRLKNGKPFVDGDFGPATKAALEKFNQDFKTS